MRESRACHEIFPRIRHSAVRDSPRPVAACLWQSYRRQAESRGAGISSYVSKRRSRGETRMKLQQIILNWLAERGLTLAELSFFSGVSPSELQKIMDGGTPDPSDGQKLFTYLEITEPHR
nr:MAG TPA: Regulatory protein-modification, helix-turn-helix, transcriptional regulator, DNA [Caudoviricetes sp.]